MRDGKSDRLIALVPPTYRNRSDEALGVGWIILAITAILVAALPPQPDWPEAGRHFWSSLRPLSVVSWIDLMANIVLYLPLGFALGGQGTSSFGAALRGGALSLTTELLQFVIPGRDARASDVVANTLGTFVGAAWTARRIGRGPRRLLLKVERWSPHVLRPQKRLASTLSLAWAMSVAAVLTMTALLLRPAPTGPGYLIPSPFIDATPGGVRIGATRDPATSLIGAIDEVRIFRVTRSADEIRNDMHEPVSGAGSHPAGLVAAYGFDEDSALIARDASGGGHDATLRNVSPTRNGRFGGALTFDGPTSEVAIAGAPHFMLRDAMTLEAWVRPAPQSAPEPVVISHERGNYHLSGVSTLAHRLRPAAGGLFGGASEELRLLDPIPTDAWTYLAATYDAEAIRLYVDGVLAATRRRWASHHAQSVALNGTSLPDGPVVDPQALRSALLGHISLHLTIACGPLRAATAPIFRVHAAGNRTVFSVNAAGSDLIVRWLTWPRRLRMPSPDYRVPQALASCSPGQSLELRLNGPLQNLHITRDGRELERGAPGLGSGWAFFFHSPLLPPWLEKCCTSVWLAALFFPFGWFARSGYQTAAGATLLAVALLIVPAGAQIPSAGFSQLTAILSGTILGAACRIRTVPRRTQLTSASP